MTKQGKSFDGWVALWLATGLVLAVVAIRKWDLVDLAAGLLLVLFAGAIAVRWAWIQALSITAAGMLFAYQGVHRFIVRPFSWSRLLALALPAFVLFYAFSWLLALWRFHRGREWRTWPFRR